MATATVTSAIAAASAAPAIPPWLSTVELFSNVALLGLQVGGIAPGAPIIATAIEDALNPLIANIASGKPKSQDTLAAFGAMVGILTALKKQDGLSAQALSNITELEKAVSDGIVAFMAGETAAPDVKTLAEPVPTV